LSIEGYVVEKIHAEVIDEDMCKLRTVGIIIKVLSNEYRDMPGSKDDAGSYQKIIFQVKEDDPDIFAIGILFTLSLMSFTYAAPRGYSEKEFIPDEQWNLGYFIQGLEFERGI